MSSVIIYENIEECLDKKFSILTKFFMHLKFERVDAQNNFHFCDKFNYPIMVHNTQWYNETVPFLNENDCYVIKIQNEKAQVIYNTTREIWT